MVDIVRLDHFIGYSKYYRIPITEETAQNGEWVQAPGDKLFNLLCSSINDFNVIAEDLGDGKKLEGLEMGVLYSKLPASIKKEVIDPDTKADVSYGGGVKKSAPSAGKKTGTDQLKINLNTGGGQGSGSGGLNV